MDAPREPRRSTSRFFRLRAVRTLAVLAAALSTVVALAPVPASASGRTGAPERTSAPERTAPGEFRGVTADDGAYVSHVARTGRQLDLTVQSPALGRAAHARVLLPAGQHGRGGALPSLWVLHGCCDAGPGWEAWTRNTDIEQATSRLRALVVMPEGGPAGFYSDWWNKGEGGAPGWETFHLTELRQLLERGLGAGGRRAVAGLSMGGFGALSYAGRHPRMFRAAASFSGIAGTRGSQQLIDSLLRQYGFDPLDLWGDPVAQRAVWRAHDPVALIHRLPRGYPLFVAAGNGTPGPLDPPDAQPDELERQLGAAGEAYVAQARARGLRVTADLYGNGTHTWPYWQRELHRALPLLAAALRA